MNIKSRLKRLEKVTDDSNFCVCNGSQPISKQTYAEDGILRNPEDVEDETCELCGREVNKDVLIIDFVSKIRIPD